MTERDEQQIVAGLKALAREGASVQASPQLEAALRKAYRRQRSVTSGKRVWALAAIAASLAAVAVSMWLRQPPPPLPERTAWNGTLEKAPPPEAPVIVRPRPKTRRVKRTPRPQVVREEIATGFIPVAGGDIFAPLDSGRVVRVSMPRSALAVFGLPVNEDRLADNVRADVLLGDDGMARAIRFVR